MIYRNLFDCLRAAKLTAHKKNWQDFYVVKIINQRNAYFFKNGHGGNAITKHQAKANHYIKIGFWFFRQGSAIYNIIKRGSK